MCLSDIENYKFPEQSLENTWFEQSKITPNLINDVKDASEWICNVVEITEKIFHTLEQEIKEKTWVDVLDIKRSPKIPNMLSAEEYCDSILKPMVEVGV